jgi:hypothetical protein
MNARVLNVMHERPTSDAKPEIYESALAKKNAAGCARSLTSRSLRMKSTAVVLNDRPLVCTLAGELA